MKARLVSATRGAEQSTGVATGVDRGSRLLESTRARRKLEARMLKERKRERERKGEKWNGEEFVPFSAFYPALDRWGLARVAQNPRNLSESLSV